MTEDDDIAAMVQAMTAPRASRGHVEVVADNRARAARRPTPALGVPVLSLVEAPAPRPTKLEALSTELATEIARNAQPAPPPDPRTVPVRFSSLKHMASSPLHYRHQVQYGRDDTLCMRIGRGAHALVLGEPIIEFPHVRSGKRWEAFKAQHSDKEILNAKEYAVANGIYGAVTSHRVASEILFGTDAVLEETLHWSLMGRACTSRPDSRRGTTVLTDLKTTRCAEPVRFARDATFRLYHGQMDFYARAMAELFGHRPDHVFCVAVESKAPYAVTVLELTPSALAEGERCWRLWFERLLVCEASNHWPAYSEAIEPLDVQEGSGDVTLLIDGEEYSYGEDS